MKQVTKGQATRQTIIDRSRQIFNEKGLDITLDNIAQEMALTKGRITNHFPTKQSLFQAIMNDYELQLADYVRHFYSANAEQTLKSSAVLVSGVMDIQYENRCGIAYISLITREQKEMFDHIQKTYQRNLQSIKTRLTNLVQQGVLKKEVISAKHFPIFAFQYINLLTTWVISAQHYGSEQGYKVIKPVYLQGIMQCYLPYLTAEGTKQYAKLNFEKIAWSV